MMEQDPTEFAVKNLRELVLAMPQARSVESLLEILVQRYREDPMLALTRIWLTRPGDRCETCKLRDLCPDRTQCLHLVAQSYGAGSHPPEENLEDDYDRIPLGVGKVGRCAVTAEVSDASPGNEDFEFSVSKRWAHQVNALGLAVLPVVYQGKVLGVNSFVPRRGADMKGEGLFWGRLVADHLAVSLVNAEAFEKIATLNNRLAEENEYLNQELVEAEAYGEILGQSPAIKAVAQQIEMVAGTEGGVLITGESGTGKELVAREVHHRSPRANRPLIKVNCASIPRDLYESEFFGHMKGAFTGAVKDRKGRFELAHGGTLFLDEIGEIPLDIQSKLLRVLQEREYERIGDERTRTADVRILAATNRDLKREVKEGRFREDLYYRLNIFPIELPPLRERREDIPLLTSYFIELACRKFNRKVKAPSQAVLKTLQQYSWPGNIRELQNLIERAVITSRRGKLFFDLPAFSNEEAIRWDEQSSHLKSKAVISENEMQRLIKENILRALDQCGGKIYGKDGAANLLGIKPTTLATRIKSLGLKKRYYSK